MSRKRNFTRGPDAYRRGKPQFPSSGKAFLIVTEGKKTEPNYLKALRVRLQLNATDVEIVHPEGTDPITLTKRAIELRDARKRSAKKGLEVAYDEVWVVFDLERTHDERRKLAKRATTIKEAVGIQFAVSDPCFEFWLLLHEESTTSPFADCQQVILRLAKHWPTYAKGTLPPAAFLEKLPVALTNAERCRKHHEDSGGDGNPSTQVDLLVRSLNAAARPARKFKID